VRRKKLVVVAGWMDRSGGDRNREEAEWQNRRGVG